MRLAAAIALALVINALLVAAVSALHGEPPRPAPPGEAPLAVQVERVRENRARAPAPPPAPRLPEPPRAAAAPLLAAPTPPPLALPPLELPGAIAVPAVHLAAPPVSTPVHAPAAPSAPRVAARSGSPEGSIASDGDVDEPARWDPTNREPAYPRGLQRRGAEGEVTVRLLIDASGAVAGAEVVEVKGGSPFGEAVLEVARSWRFAPARDGGIAVPVYARKTIHFRMAERRR